MKKPRVFVSSIVVALLVLMGLAAVPLLSRSPATHPATSPSQDTRDPWKSDTAQADAPSPNAAAVISRPDLREWAIEHPGSWGHELVAQLYALAPSELFDLLDDDEMLAREEARDLLDQVYRACGTGLALLAVAESDPQVVSHPLVTMTADNPAVSWCKDLGPEQNLNETWSRMREMLQAVRIVSPLGQDSHPEHPEDLDPLLQMHGPDALLDLMLVDNPVLVLLAAQRMLQNDDTRVIRDWTAMKSLGETQADAVWFAAKSGLECRWLRSCGLRSLSVVTLCLSENFQCAQASHLDEVLAMSLSPTQREAYDLLLAGIFRYRAQRGV